MNIVSALLLIFLVVCALSAAMAKSLFHTVLIFLCFSTVMAVIWLLLQAPDLAITEAAVGVGISGVLYFLALRRLGKLRGEDDK